MRILAPLLAAALAVAPKGPLDQARAQLALGHLDEVLFALDGKTFSGQDQIEAARLLAEAAQKSLDGKDRLFALQLAQLSLRQKADQPLALETASRASLGEQQFTPAEGYADRWLKAEPSSPRPRLLRARIALEEGEWDHVLSLLEPVEAKKLADADRAELETLRARAHSELKERGSAVTELHSLDALIAKAALRAAAENRAEQRAAAFAPKTEIVLYGTSWCGFCKKARAYLDQRGIRYEDKDIEKDHDAAEELAEKEAAKHLHNTGVPVIDVKGELVVGFDQKRLDQLL